MKYLNENFDTNEIKNLCTKFGIKNYLINTDGSVSTDSDILMSDFDECNNMFDKIPIKFKKTRGSFNFSYNHLKTLENSPFYVQKNFICSYNNLTSFTGGPKYVGGNYIANDNNIKDMKGFPLFYKGYMNLDNNPVCEILDLIPDHDLNRIALNRFIYWLNEHDVIINGDKVIKYKLQKSLSDVGMKSDALDFASIGVFGFFKNYLLI